MRIVNALWVDLGGPQWRYFAPSTLIAPRPIFCPEGRTNFTVDELKAIVAEMEKMIIAEEKANG
jgi:hypothetical protein